MLGVAEATFSSFWELLGGRWWGVEQDVCEEDTCSPKPLQPCMVGASSHAGAELDLQWDRVLPRDVGLGLAEHGWKCGVAPWEKAGKDLSKG